MQPDDEPCICCGGNVDNELPRCQECDQELGAGDA